METTWGDHRPWRPSGDDRDNGDDVGTTWGRCGDDGDDMWRPQTIETTWGPSGDDGDDRDDMVMTWGQCGDNGDDVGMTWGRRGPHGDNKITKNAITFERIEIIEFHLKIWDP